LGGKSNREEDGNPTSNKLTRNWALPEEEKSPYNCITRSKIFSTSISYTIAFEAKLHCTIEIISGSHYISHSVNTILKKKILNLIITHNNLKRTSVVSQCNKHFVYFMKKLALREGPIIPSPILF